MLLIRLRGKMCIYGLVELVITTCKLPIFWEHLLVLPDCRRFI